MLKESYDSYIAQGNAPAGDKAASAGSPHRSPLPQGALWLVMQLS
jgi:hypothetical protein